MLCFLLSYFYWYVFGFTGFVKRHGQNAVLANCFDLLGIDADREIEIALETACIAFVAEAVGLGRTRLGGCGSIDG